MIKVGQIYKVPYLGGKVVITWIRGDKTEFHMVRDDGYFLFSKDDEMGKDSVLLAEYPTWKEAVNSKEFNDGYKTDREIELEKKLKIVVQALEQYAFAEKVADSVFNGKYTKKYAQEALAKIKEIK